MDHIAHIRQDDGKIQTVSEHCRAAASLAQIYAEKAGCGNLAVLQALLHDVGKLTEKFDQYIQGKSKLRRGEIDHCFAGARYLHEIAGETKNKHLIETAALIERTIISHHGLHDWINDEGVDYHKYRIEKSDLYEEIRCNAMELFPPDEVLSILKCAAEEYASVTKKLFELAKSGAPANPKTAYAFYLGMLERFMESVLMDADRTNTADFISGSKTEISCNTGQLWERMKQNMQEKTAHFRKRTDAISQKRMDISDRCEAFAEHPIGVCRLIVPTGGGKTLSALRFAISYCCNYQMERIIYTAPFMSILEQNSDEIKHITGEDILLEHHSDMSAQIDDAEELSVYELHAERWDSSVIATTMVQLLNSLFSGKTACVRRMHRLCRSVILFDEVQSLPLRCVNLFNLAINFLTRVCGCTVVLCSATQPPLEHTDFPLLVDENMSMTGDYSADFEEFHRTQLISAVTPYGYSYEEAAAFCEETLHQNGDLLVIVNTKAAAAKLYRLLQEKMGKDTVVVHLSTNLCPEHRRERLDTLHKCLAERIPVICVATQLIEAGVDISFHCVVRSLAGLDNAAQAAGRCNRHGESKRICPVYLILLKEETLGSLTEIKRAQDLTLAMLRFAGDADMLSPEKLEEYFGERYDCDAEMLSYPYLPEQTSLLSLLSLNKDWFNMMSQKNHSPYTVQAFKTAGTAFQVIESNTTDVIVPYNTEAEHLIQELDMQQNSGVWRTLLRKAQKYTVSVYQGMNRKLSEYHAIRTLKSGAFVLDKAFYHAELGVITEGAQQEVLLY